MGRRKGREADRDREKQSDAWTATANVRATEIQHKMGCGRIDTVFQKKRKEECCCTWSGGGVSESDYIC